MQKLDFLRKVTIVIDSPSHPPWRKIGNPSCEKPNKGQSPCIYSIQTVKKKLQPLKNNVVKIRLRNLVHPVALKWGKKIFRKDVLERIYRNKTSSGYMLAHAYKSGTSLDGQKGCNRNHQFFKKCSFYPFILSSSGLMPWCNESTKQRFAPINKYC